MNATQAINLKIMELVAGGMPIDEALDMVLGAGTFAKLAEEVYVALRK